LDTAQRGEMARPSERRVSAIPDVPQAFSGMGGCRDVPERSGQAGEGLQGFRDAGMLHRRDFCQCEKRGDAVGKTKRGKGSKIMVIGDAAGLPVAAHVASASPHESTLVEETLEASWSDSDPGMLIGDKAYDSDGLDRKLKEDRGTELIAPNRSNRQSRTQDGRRLRRYRRRWKIERINAWLQNFRRVVIRWEVKAKNYLGFVLMACMVIIGRNI